VRVVTYNIRHGQGTASGISTDRIAGVVRECRADIVGMNEVWRVGRFFDQPAYLGKQLGFEFAFAANAEAGLWHQGNLVLTRGRIVRWENVALPRGIERRGCLVAEIDLDGERVVFASPHLSLGPAARRAQLEALARELPDGVPLVLAGDLNCDGEELEPLRSRYQFAPSLATYPASRPRRALDHVAFGCHLQLTDVSVVQTRASDHLPLVADLSTRR
jgi:endonuclease/exonuclease/phosphatase family metal-dependent hydrolase